MKKRSVPISEFVRISEAIHLYGDFAVNHSRIYRKFAIQILINPSGTLLLYYYHYILLPRNYLGALGVRF